MLHEQQTLITGSNRRNTCCKWKVSSQSIRIQNILVSAIIDSTKHKSALKVPPSVLGSVLPVSDGSRRNTNQACLQTNDELYFRNARELPAERPHNTERWPHNNVLRALHTFCPFSPTHPTVGESMCRTTRFIELYNYNLCNSEPNNVIGPDVLQLKRTLKYCTHIKTFPPSGKIRSKTELNIVYMLLFTKVLHETWRGHLEHCNREFDWP
jgi:hypothetical protein